ncbi:MAG: hypothetical protein Kow0013_18870 [Pararhodobacter sp.]
MPAWAEHDASSRDARLTRHLREVLSTHNRETVWSLTVDFMRSLGFVHALYGYSPDSRGARLGAPEDFQVLSTLRPEVTSAMVEGGHYLQSTTFHWALRNVGVGCWSMTAEECGLGPEFVVSPASMAFFEENGLMTGCCIGFPKERTRGNAVLSLIGDPARPQSDIDAIIAENEDVIFVAATVAHRCITSLPMELPRRKLTPRQREVLEWVAEGKTSADIATIMGLSVPTVEKHLRLAREALGVETTAHALIKASFLNQMFIADNQPDPFRHDARGVRLRRPGDGR